LGQLRRLANIYKRPLAVFYLPERPVDQRPLKDFRSHRESVGLIEQSPELLLAVRRARDRRDWALELYELLGLEPPRFSESLRMGDDVEEAAAKVRKALGIRFESQTQWRLNYEALRNWRLTIESAGILTFQATDVDTREARGFSISQNPLPVAVANIKDAARGRIFTFIHEVVHIMLNEGGICDFADNSQESLLVSAESFCNRVAGATLFPKTEFLAADIVQHHRKGDPTWSDFDLQDLSRRFGGSREAALVRLLSLNLTTWEFYLRKREELYQQYQEARKKQKGFVPPHTLAITSAGLTFSRLVLEGLDRGKITASDFADYLQIRFKHLADVRRDISQQVEVS
jgi:Zn-dependent peptidase ImmA (M78 family)